MSVVQFVLPPTWSTLAGEDLSQLSCAAGTVGEALSWLVHRYPIFNDRIFLRDDDFELAPWTIVCLDHVQIHDPDTAITAAARELQIIPALVGG